MKILTYFQNILNLFKKYQSFLDKFKKNNVEASLISPIFQDTEKISRSVYSPMNVKKDYTLRNNTFTTPPEKDEVSVNRLSYTTPNFVKKISKIIAKPEDNRNYFGLAILNAEEVYACDSKLVYSPNYIETAKEKIHNPFHSDIKIGYIKERGKQLPIEISYKIDLMIEKARFYQDKNPNSDFWDSEELI